MGIFPTKEVIKMFELTPSKKYTKGVLDWFDDIDRRFYPDFSNTPIFKTDVIDKGDYILIEAELPGISKEDILIDATEEYLTIKAKSEKKEVTQSQQEEYIHTERYYGTFARKFRMENVNMDDIHASMKDGVLSIKLPKKQKETNQVKRIEIE